MNDDETPGFESHDAVDDFGPDQTIADDDFDAAPDGELVDDLQADEPVGQVAEPTASGWSPPESTGVEAVDSAVAALLDLDGLPTAEHVARYEGVHRQLQDALADLDGS